MGRLGQANGQEASTPRRSALALAACALIALAFEGVLFAIGLAVVGGDSHFLPARAAIWFGILVFCYLLRPRGRLFSVSVVDEPVLLRRGITAIALIAVAVAVFLVMSHPYYLGFSPDDGPSDSSEPTWYNEDAQDEYDLLADALLKGQLYLDVQPPDYLLTMDNPYDPVVREAYGAQTGVYYKWDYAFFNGRYYVYFGVVPCLLFFVPYRAITGGAPLPTGTVVLVLCIAFIFGTAGLISYLGRRRFNHARLGAVFIGYLGVLLCSDMLVALLYPSLYLIPMMTALAFSVWGFYFWLKAWETGRIRWIVIGSICIALLIGCRPTLAITACFALLFLVALVQRGRKEGEGEGDDPSLPIAEAAKARVRDTTGAKFGNFDSMLTRKGVIALLAPFAVVAVAIGWYNAARFGSPLDFGSSYNLTATDLTARGFNPARMVNGIYNYLLQPPMFSTDFPYLQPAVLQTVYGDDYIEPMVGGVLLCYPFLWLCLLAGRIRRHRTTYLTVVVLCCCATLLALVDVEAGGLVARYQLDFAFMFAIAAAIVVICRSHDRVLRLSLEGGEEEPADIRSRALLVAIVLVTAAFCVVCSLFLLSSVSGSTGTDYFGHVPGAQEYAESFFQF